MHNTCRTTSMPNHLSVASRITEIWPFEFREISTFREDWTLVIAFLKWNSKIGLRQAVVQVPYCHHQPSVFSVHAKTAEEIDVEKYNFRNFTSSATLTLDRAEIILVRISGRCLPTQQMTPKSEKNFLWTYGRTDTPEFYSIRSSPGDDLG